MGAIGVDSLKKNQRAKPPVVIRVIVVSASELKHCLLLTHNANTTYLVYQNCLGPNTTARAKNAKMLACPTRSVPHPAQRQRHIGIPAALAGHSRLHSTALHLPWPQQQQQIGPDAVVSQDALLGPAAPRAAEAALYIGKHAVISGAGPCGKRGFGGHKFVAAPLVPSVATRNLTRNTPALAMAQFKLQCVAVNTSTTHPTLQAASVPCTWRSTASQWTCMNAARRHPALTRPCTLARAASASCSTAG